MIRIVVTTDDLLTGRSVLPVLRVADIRSSCSTGITSKSVNPTARSCGTNALALPTSTIDRRSGLM